MNKNVSFLLHLLFAFILVAELAGRLTGNIGLEYPVKPLIMVWITVYFLLFRKKREFTVPVLVAFACSWTGDILLMFSRTNEAFFYAGVAGFFFAQLAYIMVFTRYSEQRVKGFLQRHPYMAAGFLLYGGIVYRVLLPGLEGVMKPVILVYALSLVTMSMMALNRKDRVNRSSYLLTFAGSLLFVFSDSLIALDKFFRTVPLAGFWIMVTYVAAQYLIMRGLILEKESEPDQTHLRT